MDDFAAKRQALLESGVRMMDPDTVYVEAGVTVGAGTLLLPGTILRGNTVVGANCEIGPNTMLTDCTVGDGAVRAPSRPAPMWVPSPISAPTAMWAGM
mgnify:CR=1 FL=1